jgi:hypothetical protein
MSVKELPKLKIDFILNAPLLTNWGTYEYSKYDPNSCIVDFSKTISAVGHASTAEFLSKLLKIPVKINRIEVRMEIGDIALVFALKERQFEGKIMSLKELEKIGYDIGILRRID